MSERKTFDIRKHILLLGVFLVVLFSSTVIVYGAYSYTASRSEQSSAQTYASGNIFFKVNKGNTAYINKTITAKWNSQPTTVANAVASSQRVNLSQSTGNPSVTIPAYVNTAKGPVSTNLTGGNYVYTYSATSYLYLKFNADFTMPKGYELNEQVVNVYNDGNSGPVAFGVAYNTNMLSASENDRTANTQFLVNVASFSLKTEDKTVSGTTKRYKYTGYGVTYNLKPNVTTVTFNGNGSTGGSTADQTVTYDTSTNLRANGFTRTGYVFTGWNTKADGTGTSYAAGANVATTWPATNNVTLYAQWRPAKMTVNFNVNGGTITTGSGATRYRVSNNLVQVSNNSGSSWADLTNVIESTAQHYNMWNVSTYGATKTGYHVDGSKAYNTNSAGTGTNIHQDDSNTNTTNVATTTRINGSQISADVTKTVYINWLPNVLTINYDANGGTVENADYKLNNGIFQTAAGSNVVTVCNYNAQCNPYNIATFGLTRTGYHIEEGEEWNLAANGSGMSFDENEDKTAQSYSSALESGNSTITLYANWKGNEGNIEFDANGGDGFMDDQEYKFGTTANLDECEFINEGYRFVGWNTKEDGTGDYYADKADIRTAFPTGDAYLYAIWQPADYTLHFDGNEETGGEMEDVQGEIGVPLTLPPNEFYKTEKVFKEWNTMPDGTGYSYKNKSEYTVNPNMLNNTEQMNFTVGDGTWDNGRFRNASTDFTDNREVVEITDSPVKGLDKAYKITSTADTHTDIAQDGVPVVAGEVYTMSVWAKGQGNLLLQYGDDSNYANTQYPINSDEWKLYTYTFTAGEEGTITNGKTNIYFGNQSTEDGQELYLTGLKLEKGDKATPYFISDENEVTLYAQWLGGSFKLEGETSVSGYKFEEVYPENGKLDFTTKLGNGQFFSIFDLDKEAQYKVAELGNNNTRNYSPSFEVTEGGYAVDAKKGEAEKGETLSTPEEILSANMNYQYTNSRSTPEGKTLEFTKKVQGDNLTAADKTKAFLFSYYIDGLDPEQTYPYEHQTDADPPEVPYTLTPTTTMNPSDTGYETSGVITGTVYLKDGESFTVNGLPEGAKYNITEVFAESASFVPSDWQFKTTYEVTSGEDTTVKDFDTNEGKNLPYGLSINADGEVNGQGLGVETIGEEDVSYTFKNAKTTPHNLTLSKEVTLDNAHTTSSEEFEITVSLSNLSPNRIYTVSDSQYNFTADDKGKAEFTVTLTPGRDVTIFNLPGDVEYTVTEEETPYVASGKIMNPAMIYETSGMYGQGVSVSNDQSKIDSDDEIGFSEDQTVLFTNNRNTKHSLTIDKSVVGDSASENDTFTFNVDFTGLNGTCNVTKTYIDENEEEVSTTSSFNQTGDYTYSFTLKAGETIRIDNLPNNSTYKITETGTEGYIPSYESDSPVSKSSDVGESGENLSTPTETIITDTAYSFTNTKDNPPPTKKVSDTDNFTLDGEGSEVLVDENSVPNKSKTWTYTIKQRVYKGFDSFTFTDKIPENIVLTNPTDIVIKWTKENGSVISQPLVPDESEEQYGEENEEFVSSMYKSGSFYVETSDGVNVISEDSDLIADGGTFEIVIPVKVDPNATMEDFKSAGQIYKVNERLQLKNRASTTLGIDNFTNEFNTNLVKTNIPLNTALNIKKNVTGNLGDLTKKFEYEVKLSGLTPNKKYTYEKPTYVKVHGDYDDEEYLTITATDEMDRPINKVEIQVFKEVETEEPEPADSTEEDDDEEIVIEPDEPEYILVAKRTTGENGQTRFMLEPGEYKYVITYDNEKTEGFFTAALNEEGEQEDSILVGTVHELDEIYFERTDYDTEKYFLTDENGEAVIEFKLSDDQEMLFTKLPMNVVYEIKEKASNHTPSFEVTEGEVETRSKAMEDKEVEITTGKEILKGTTSYLFTNNRELEPRTAGYVMLISMLILTLTGLIFTLIWRKRNKTLKEI